MLRLNKLKDFNDDVFRNIVSLRTTQDLFDDLHDQDESSANLAIAAEMRVKDAIPTGQIERGLHYSTVVGHPFATENYQATRYSDGSYPVWYASLDLKTTIYETAHHMVKEQSAIEGVNEVVIRERAVYRVHCQAALIDLTTQRAPSLIDMHDYTVTQQVGRRIYYEGHPGLLVPSARYLPGKNAVIFHARVLRDPRLVCYLTYRLDPLKSRLNVERTPGRVWFKIEL